MSDSKSLKDTFNPFNWPDHLRQRREKNPDDPNAREVHDPHTWEDLDPSLRDRLTPDTTGQWLVVLAVGLVFAGLVLYLYPVFGTTFQNPISLGAFFLLSTFIVVYLKGRQDGIHAYIDLAKSVIYYGDDVDVRLGEEKEETGGRNRFTPYVNLSYGGYNKRPLKKRDLPYNADKLRSNRGDDTGEEEVVDRLNATTVRKDTDNFGTVLFTHAFDLDYDDGNNSDRYTPLPNEMDEDVVDDVNSLIDNLEHRITTLQQKISMQEQSNEELRDLKNQELSPELNQIIHLMVQLRDTFEPNNRQRSSSNPLNSDDPYDAVEEMEAQQ